MAVQVTMPLTTIFTPAASCVSHWTYQGSYYNGVPNGILLQNAVGATPDYSCFPTGFEQVGRAHHGTYIYSPGYCPAGYSTASQSTDSITTAVCCPTNYSFFAVNGTATRGAVTTDLLEGCTSVFSSGSTTTVPGVSGDGTMKTTAVTGPLTMWAQPISIAFTQADIAMYTAAATVASVTAMSTPATEAATSTLGPAATTSMELSKGGIAGIAIGAAAGTALLIGVVFLCWRTKMPRQPAASTSDVDAEPMSATSEYSLGYPMVKGEPKLVHESGDSVQHVHELSTDPRITGQALEMPSDPRATRHRVELPADPRITGERLEVDGSVPGQAY